MRDKKMRKVTKKHRRWKINALADYARQCELYILKRKNWEFHTILQIWEKSDVLWLVVINTFNDLIELARANYEEFTNYTKLTENENVLRVATKTYFDEIEQKIFFNSSEKAKKSKTFTTDDDEISINNSTQVHMMTKTLQSSEDSNHAKILTLISLKSSWILHKTSRKISLINSRISQIKTYLSTQSFKK